MQHTQAAARPNGQAYPVSRLPSQPPAASSSSRPPTVASSAQSVNGTSNGASTKGSFTSRLPAGGAAPSRPQQPPARSTPAPAPSAVTAAALALTNGSASQLRPQVPVTDKATLEAEVTALANDLADLHKSVRQAVDPAAHSLSPDQANSILAGEVRRTSSTLLRVVATANGTPTKIIDRLTENASSKEDAARDSKLGEMDGWMREMKAQMLAMQAKQAELVQENQKWKDDAVLAKRDMVKQIEESQKSFTQGLGGAVRAELKGDLQQRLDNAIKTEATKVVGSMFHQKVIELQQHHQEALGDAFENGRGAGYNDAMNGQPPPIPPQPQQPYYQGPSLPHLHGHPPAHSPIGPQGYGAPPPPPPPPPHNPGAEFVTAAQLRAFKVERVDELQVVDKSINEKLSKFGLKLEGGYKKHLDALDQRIKALEKRASSRSVEGSPAAPPGVQNDASRKRARTKEDSGSDMSITSADMAAEASARKALADEVSKVKKDLERLGSQITSVSEAQAPATLASISTPAPSATSLAGYVTKFAHTSAMDEINEKVTELETASRKTNERMREQKDKIKDELGRDLNEVKSELQSRIAAAERSINRVESNQAPPITLAEVVTTVDSRLEDLAVNTLETRLTELALEVTNLGPLAQDLADLSERTTTLESDVAENVKIQNEDQDALAAFKESYAEDYQATKMLTASAEGNIPGQIARRLEEIDWKGKVLPVVQNELADWTANEGVQRLMQPSLEKVEKDLEKRFGDVERNVASNTERVTKNEGAIGRLELRHASHEQARADTNAQLAKLDVSLRTIAAPMQTMINALSGPPQSQAPTPQMQSPLVSQGQTMQQLQQAQARHQQAQQQAHQVQQQAHQVQQQTLQ